MQVFCDIKKDRRVPLFLQNLRTDCFDGLNGLQHRERRERFLLPLPRALYGFSGKIKTITATAVIWSKYGAIHASRCLLQKGGGKKAMDSPKL